MKLVRFVESHTCRYWLFLLKSVILVFCVLIGLQGLSLAGRSLLVLSGHPEFAPQDDETEKF